MRVAMYCFYNHGWKPSEYINMPLKERITVACMAEYEIANRPKNK